MIAHEYSGSTARQIESTLQFFVQYRIKIDRLGKILYHHSTEILVVQKMLQTVIIVVKKVLQVLLLCL